MYTDPNLVELRALTMTSTKEEPGLQPSTALDALIRVFDEQIAAIGLPEIPRPVGDVDGSRVTAALQAEVDELCDQRALNWREQERWMVEAQRAISEGDDVRAREAMTHHAEHLRLAQEADALLTEFQTLITEVRRSLSPTGDRVSQ